MPNSMEFFFKKPLPGGLSLSGSPDVANCSLQLFFPTKLWYILQPVVQWHFRLLNKSYFGLSLNVPYKVVQLLPPDFCPGSLPSVVLL